MPSVALSQVPEAAWLLRQLLEYAYTGPKPTKGLAVKVTELEAAARKAAEEEAASLATPEQAACADPPPRVPSASRQRAAASRVASQSRAA